MVLLVFSSSSSSLSESNTIAGATGRCLLVRTLDVSIKVDVVAMGDGGSGTRLPSESELTRRRAISGRVGRDGGGASSSDDGVGCGGGIPNKGRESMRSTVPLGRTGGGGAS